MNWERYEQRKAAWVQAHPQATSEEYEQAARREFRENKPCNAPSVTRTTSTASAQRESEHVR